ncbi:polysaccharide deacetylase family protein [Ornithinimicrobium sp. Y1694]|uniref:polysaccharide deacetylase family protein n=1 Tax=Ornithinimicrobium sp. Y1694 TaxID=3418590 RepID=UPI003CFB8E3B
MPVLSIIALMALLGATFIAPAATAAAAFATPAATAAAAFATPTSAPSAPATTAISGPPTSRLAGSDRYATAVAISRHRFADPASARTVYLTRGDSFLHALLAGQLTDGPVLLVRPNCADLPTTVRAEIDRLNPTTVIALGTTSGVCDDILKTAADGRHTERITGPTHADIARHLASRAFPRGADTAYLTRGKVSPDAVAAGQLSDGPVLLTSADGQSIPPATQQAIDNLHPTTIIALGGTATIPDATLRRAADGRQTARLGGDDRYATAARIAAHAYPQRTARAYLARGDGSHYADAITSGMLTDGPVLLTQGACTKIRGSAAATLTARHPDRLIALGGTGALCDSLLAGASLAARPKPDCAVLKCVALTYDDGPAWPTPGLLDTLARERVPVTFFVVGQMVDARPGTAVRAWREGHQIANHSWSHPQLSTLTLTEQRTQVASTEAELRSHGIPSPTLLRPPYGSYDANTRRLGYPLIIWDVDPSDWDGPPSPATTRARVLADVTPGSIVLMHDLHNNTVLAAPGIIADLKAQGYTMVTVSELIPNLRAGDLVYRRGTVVPADVPMSPDQLIETDGGRTLGPQLDGSGIPGVAREIPLLELLEEISG